MPLVQNILTLIKVSLATSEQTASPFRRLNRTPDFAELLTGDVMGEAEDLQKGILWGNLRMQKFENEYTFLLSLSLKLQMLLGHGGRL